MPKKRKQGGKKGKRTDESPARKRYVGEKRGLRRKLRRVQGHAGPEAAEAYRRLKDL